MPSGSLRKDPELIVNKLLNIRQAELCDVNRIFELLEMYAAKRIVLSRSRDDIALFIGNFVVAEYEGEVCGCAAVRDFGNDLLEIHWRYGFDTNVDEETQKVIYEALGHDGNDEGKAFLNNLSYIHYDSRA